ncbi:tetratricopeptide repeat protein [Telmatobacter sp. DSM 110680]|uniref:Tetratricopeptide repeat protein n=1 Tax=Telmatobacter sp. DSM 110680 TaxID=3036704 RepID=A0AAU7DKJ8_9BACT
MKLLKIGYQFAQVVLSSYWAKMARGGRRFQIVALLGLGFLCGAYNQQVPAQAGISGSATVHGKVLNAAGEPVVGATVHLQQKGTSKAETVADAKGEYTFAGLASGSYVLIAEVAGVQSHDAALTISSLHSQYELDLRLVNPSTNGDKSHKGSTASAAAMEFADNPNFAVAGVTDWTAAGGHGSDTSLRTSEALTRETLTLKPGAVGPGTTAIPADGAAARTSEEKLRTAVTDAPRDFEANHRLGEFYLRQGRYPEAATLLKTAFEINPRDFDNEYDLAQACENVGDLTQARNHVQQLLAEHDAADLHRLAGSIDEKLGDPLTAVHEYEQAVRMDPSEQNYFEWGSELLYHRAVWQAQAVFEQGVKGFPKSARMLTALGAALFAGALYDDAANRLCEASDLNPADPDPYTFMGKIEIAAPNPLACVREKLERFVRLQPDNALANYFYAMALWKENGRSTDPQTMQRIEAMLTKAVSVDPKCAEAYLQLGNLDASKREFEKATSLYSKAIEVSPQLSEAHYRLGVAYERIGEKEKAKLEFQKHDEIEKQTAAEVLRQRKDVKQFVIALPPNPASPPLN